MNARLPAPVAETVRGVLGVSVARARVERVGGGSINHAAAVTVDGRSLFVKWHPGAPDGFFAAEADGLRRLAATGTVRVPEVLAVDDRSPTACLVLSRIDMGSRNAEAMEDAGRRLAQPLRKVMGQGHKAL